MSNFEKKPSDAEEIFDEYRRTQEVVEKPPEQVPNDEPQQEQIQVEEVTETEPTEIREEPEKIPEQQTQPSKNEGEEHARNVIYVGTKPIMTYVTATLTQLSTEPLITIKARGKRITQAVDVSQMIVKRMNTVGYTVQKVRISSDSLTSQDGRQRNVSTIEIDIAKKENS